MTIENTIVPYTHTFNPLMSTQIVQALTGQDTPVDSSTRSDLVQICTHNYQHVHKNIDVTCTTSVHVTNFGAKRLDVDQWNDVFILGQFNKISTFNEAILAYKVKIHEVSQPVDCFYHLKDVSKEITLSILKTLRLRDRGDDAKQFIDVLTASQMDSQKMEHFYSFYNILLYVVPYAFSLANADPTISFIINFSPYDYCAHVIQTMNMDLDTGNISWIMRQQASLEANLPETGFYRNWYNTLRPTLTRGFFMYNHRYQYFSLALIQTTRYVISPFVLAHIDSLIPSSNSDNLLLHSTFPTSHVPSEESDLRDIVFHQILNHFN